MKRIMLFALLLALLFVAGSSFAQDSKEDATSQAAALYKLGAEEYLRGNYVDALALFRKGYDLMPNSMFLYNISLVYGKLNNFPEALSYAKRAHQEGDLPPDAWSRNIPRIHAYRMAIRSQQLVTNRHVCGSEDCGEGTREARQFASDPGVASRTEPASKPTWLGWTGLAVTAGGAAFLSMALLKNFEVSDLADTYDERRLANDIDGANSTKQEIEDAQSLGQVFLYAGAGLTAVGLGLFVYDLVRDTEPTIALIPALGEDSVGVWATGSF